VNVALPSFEEVWLSSVKSFSIPHLVVASLVIGSGSGYIMALLIGVAVVPIAEISLLVQLGYKRPYDALSNGCNRRQDCHQTPNPS
jgi:hypothetical protein